jgi:hypothetical protein
VVAGGASHVAPAAIVGSAGGSVGGGVHVGHRCAAADEGCAAMELSLRN